jgi:hypothetical protein
MENSKNTHNTSDKYLSELALKLLLNAIDASSEDYKDQNEKVKMVKFFLKNSYASEFKAHKIDVATNSRNILIIGNGATIDAIGDNASTDKLANKIEGMMCKKNGLVKDFLVRQKEKYKNAFNLNPKQFETRLTACAAFDENTVRNILNREINYKYVPSKFYELAAHFFKHRYVDIIINFNFDEILDTIIKEEQGGSEYKNILHDGDCPHVINELKVDERLKMPIYIKPHGTISYDSSLLFTKEHYHNLEVLPKIRATVVRN